METIIFSVISNAIGFLTGAFLTILIYVICRLIKRLEK